MRCLVLGSAAGGGFPQWNCACLNCTLARAGAPNARPRTQAGIAATADGKSWLLVGASPDLRQQILANPALAPNGPRHSPIAAVVLINADIDGLAGLLVLREQHPFRLYAPAEILKVLSANPLFGVLDPALVERIEIAPETQIDTGLGLVLTLLPMPGKIPLYQENRASLTAEPAPTHAVKLESNGQQTIIAPACAELNDTVLASLAQADLLFFDGTLFTDTEMIAANLGVKTSRRMGHVPVSGENGSLLRLASLAARKIYLHINNSNPMLLEDSPERREVQAAGFEVAHDGMDIQTDKPGRPGLNDGGLECLTPAGFQGQSP